MTSRIPLGAINKKTGKYAYPKLSCKSDDYYCPDCNKDIILCKGEIRNPYFRHKFDDCIPCNYYNSPSESQIHKDAKYALKTVLENKTPVTLFRICMCCKNKEIFEIPEIDNTSKIIIEYPFHYNGSRRAADVAYLDNGELVCILEIYNTSKTRREDRPDPWFEIDALQFINKLNDDNFNELEIQCIRCEKCEDCIEKEANERSIIRNEVKNKSSGNERDCSPDHSYNILDMLIDIICGDDKYNSYTKWKECYISLDEDDEDTCENELDIGQDFNILDGDGRVYYDRELINVIKNLHLYKYLIELDVDRGTIMFKLSSITNYIRRPLYKLCRELFTGECEIIEVSNITKQQKIMSIKNANGTKLPIMEERLAIEIKNDTSDYNTSPALIKLEAQVRNIKDELEIKLIENDICYCNHDNVKFEITHPYKKENITLLSDSSYSMIEILDWYNSVSSRFNIIDCAFKVENLIENIWKSVKDKDIFRLNSLVSELEEYIHRLKVNGYNHEADTISISKNKKLDLEIDLVKNNIQYSEQETTGLPIYIITLPGTKEVIKYAISSGKVYRNKKWYTSRELGLYNVLFYNRK